MTQAFFNPWEFSFMHDHFDEGTGEVQNHLFINGLDVFDVMHDAKLHYDHNNYNEFGYSLGYALD